MPTRTIELTDQLDNLIVTSVASGRFSNADEVVGEALRLLEERDEEYQTKLEWLRSAAKEGFDAIDRGESTTIHSEEELLAYLNEIREEVLAEPALKRA